MNPDVINVASLQSQVATLSARNDHLCAEVDHLKQLIAKLRHQLFGRRSEKVPSGLFDQLNLCLNEISAASVAPTPAVGVPVEVPPRQARRKPLPEQLPRLRQIHLPEHTCCPACGGELKALGEDIGERLEYVPAHYQVIVDVRPKFACAQCDVIVQAPAPHHPIPRGLPGPGLLAHVLTGKYCDHLPLNRQCNIFARAGIELERSTLAGWVKQCHELLHPLVEALRGYVLQAHKLHGDDTPVPVLAPGRTQTGRLWTYVRDDRPAGSSDPPAVWFAYSANRRGEHPRAHLRPFRGALQADAYAGFGPLYDSGVIVETACWAHLRRKFHELHLSHPSGLSTQALQQIGALYDIERDIRGKPPEVRLAERTRRAVPQIEAFRAWLEQTLSTVSKKSSLAQAIGYGLARWPAFERYAQDGTLEIDNNAAERALRCVALGRKNYMFLGSDAGGERAASLYSLIGTAKLNGRDPEGYLREVLSRIADHPLHKVAQLLPWNMAAAH